MVGNNWQWFVLAMANCWQFLENSESWVHHVGKGWLMMANSERSLFLALTVMGQ